MKSPAKKTTASKPRRTAAAAKPKAVAAAKPKAGLVTFARGYDVVDPRIARMRRAAVVETAGEDVQLPSSKRNRLTNLLRDMLRNSPAFVMQNRQMCINVVGSTGGKMYASFPAGYEAAAEEVMDYFNRVWAPRAEFSYGKNFNWLLKTVLTTKDVCGNVLLVFDDGILSGGEGTGRIRAFEGDEIADVPDVTKFFPESYTQSQGFVYNALGMFCGAFVSTRQRGRDIFTPEEGLIKLRRDPFARTIGNWNVLGDMMRFNQGRAVSPLTSALVSLIDLHETVSSEALAAKFNAQLVAQILNTDTESMSGMADAAAGAFDGESSGDSGEGGVVEVPKNEALKNIGLHAQEMPPGRRLELLDTKRPNPNMPNYVDFVVGLVGGARGLARVYSTLKAQTSYTAFRGEQIMTWKSFQDMQKELEREVCDWAARQVIARAVKLREIRAKLPEGWEKMIAWTWPRMIEVSEKDAQSALQLKLQNGVTSLRRELGPGEYERIRAERKAEKKDFDADELIYPGETSVSGAIKPETEPASDGGTGAADDETQNDEGGENADA